MGTRTVRQPSVLADLQAVATGRSRSLFASAIAASEDPLKAAYEGKTLLIVGAAGTIARATLLELLAYGPAHLVLADIDENGLTRLTRQLRNALPDHSLPRLSPVLLDVTSRAVASIAIEFPRIDAILNFAACKHVRSERDALSLLRMLDVNVVGAQRLKELAKSLRGSPRVFSVSTDKAANPANFMGASKRIMEALLLQDSDITSRSARFANVAFSQGSLLESWLDRIESQEPMPVPVSTDRYFVSTVEAGQLCLLADAVVPEHSIAVPTTGPELGLRSLQGLAHEILDYLSLGAETVDSEEEAWRLHRQREAGSERQIVLLTPRDTEGEKPFEEFTAATDRPANWHLAGVSAVIPEYLDSRSLHDFVEWLEGMATLGSLTSKPEFKERIQQIVPTFSWVAADRRLDDRM